MTNSVADEARGLPREPTAPWIRGLVVVVVAVWLTVVAWQVVVLPDRVPTHFDGSGQADGWSSRNGALAFSAIFPLLVVLPMPLLSRMALHWPHAINGPNRHWWTATPRRLIRFERLMREDLWVITVLTMALLVAIQVGITLTAVAGNESISTTFLFGGLGAYLVAMVVVMARMYGGGRYADQPDLG